MQNGTGIRVKMNSKRFLNSQVVNAPFYIRFCYRLDAKRLPNKSNSHDFKKTHRAAPKDSSETGMIVANGLWRQTMFLCRLAETKKSN